MINNIQITIGAGVTQVATTSITVKQLSFQNNGGHNIRVGGHMVTSSLGMLIATGTPGGALTFGDGVTVSSNLREWYIAGTQNDVIEVMYVT